MNKIKYIVCSGWVYSDDGDTHFISCDALMRLYRVKPSECVLAILPTQSRIEHICYGVDHRRVDSDYRTQDSKIAYYRSVYLDVIELHPSSTGAYSLDNK